jgi:hypothetical protein
MPIQEQLSEGGEMAWKMVAWYSLGYHIVSKQCYVYYSLEGENVANQIFVTAPEMLALADMFRNEGPVSCNTDGPYFVTNQEQIGEGELTIVQPNPPA